MNFIKKILETMTSALESIPRWVISLAARLVIFRVFWLSVQTKIDGLTIAGQDFAFWSLTDNVYYQFWEHPKPFDSEFMIYAGTFAEFFFSIAILLGLFTRFAAIGMLGVVAVIQIVQPQAWWSVHVYWALLLIFIVREGGGLVSVDKLIGIR